jgi:predicted N-acyltransferase
MEPRLELRIINKISEVSREQWDRLVGVSSPFLRWDWLDCLEQTACVGARTGWAPHHVVVEEAGRLAAACPMYLKGHSMGEFVFDHEWADFASRIGIPYYPKILVGVPFTPVTGPRFLTDPMDDRNALIELIARALIALCEQNKISSVHVNFCSHDEARALEGAGYLARTGIQFHWQNQGFRSFDDYLGSFRSDRRNKIKRERREVSARGISIRAVEEGELTPGLLRTMFKLYKHHVDQLYYGRQYLTRGFFDEAAQRFKPFLRPIVAEREGRIIAGTFNVEGKTALYGRYWGAFEDVPFLHFNVCYYAAIEHCIQKGLEKFEAGAGGSFKQLRGLEPETTYSMHYVVDPRFRRALQEHLKQEHAYVQSKKETLLERSQLKKEQSR